MRAAIMMVAAITSFCINDAFVKGLSGHLPLGEIIAVRGLFVITLLLVLLPRLGLRLGRPDRYAVLRAAAEVGVTFTFLGALKVLPLGDTYTLYFAAPLMLTATAALFMGERVGLRRWAAVIVGFVGVLIALGLPSSWQPASLLALLAAAISVLRDVFTRRVAADVGSGTVALVTAALVTFAGGLTSLGGWIAPGWSDVGLCALAALGAAGGYVGFVAATRAGDISFIATFRYAGIPVAMALGLVVWGDVPSLQMLSGAILIVGSGVYILIREHRLAKAGGAPVTARA